MEILLKKCSKEMKDNPLVSVCMITFNHESYIREAIEGVLMQKINFTIELIIGEDCSTDNTRKIVKEYEALYPEIIVAQYPETNRGMMRNFTSVLQSARGKYIALCEGDDFWTDPLKLQKQVDFLEMNEEYSICFHNVKIFKENENKFMADYITREVNETSDIYELAKANYIHTPSVLFRNIITEFPTEFYNSPAGDYFLHMLNAQFGKIKKLKDCMAVYRVHEGGVWSTKSNKESILTYLDLMIKYFEDEKILAILQKRKQSIIKADKMPKKILIQIKKIINELFNGC